VLSRLAPEPGLEAEGQLHTARAGSHHDQAMLAVLVGRLSKDGVYPFHQVSDGTCRDRVLANAGKILPRHGRSHVEGSHVVDDRCLSLDVDDARVGVNADGFPEDDPRPSASGERSQRDFQITRAILSRHESGDHSGIERGLAIDDQSQPRSRLGIARPRAQDLDVGVARAHENHLAISIHRRVLVCDDGGALISGSLHRPNGGR
jgi:hypothetical protein